MSGGGVSSIQNYEKTKEECNHLFIIQNDNGNLIKMVCAICGKNKIIPKENKV